MQLAKLRIEPSHLAIAALCLWFFSLFFPGFKYGFGGETLNGIYILLLGIPFGWMSNGWAVYANVFFISVFFKVISEKKPVWSVLFMVGFAATLPLCNEILVNENGGMSPITAWGWGAIIWIEALILMACAAFVQIGLLGARGLWLSGILMIAVFLGVYQLHLRQLREANEQEKTLFLSGKMAFMTLDPCGIEVTWPERQMIQSNATLGVYMDAQLTEPKKGMPHLYLPMPDNYIEIQDDREWMVYGQYKGYGIRVLRAKQNNYPVLEAKANQGGAVIRLIGEKKEVLFEQLLRIKSLGDRSYYCPLDSQYEKNYPQGKLADGVDSALKIVLGFNGSPKQMEKKSAISDELAEEHCGFHMIRLKDGKLHGVMDRRNVIIDFSWIEDYTEFCSDHYVALVQVNEGTKNDHSLGGSMFLFDRNTLRPIVRFTSNSRKGSDKYSFLNPNKLQSVRISQSSMLVQTEIGQLIAENAEFF
ncbi:hypothetical protein [Methylomonas sp. MK1]|uniref:hypothetical protein n=1 Tax=Methylomonas sp. MK1 TaxID=1131552 RepID=UPI00036E7E8D|nr:hypothetical protein [Methylomonas sp. MK1]